MVRQSMALRLLLEFLMECTSDTRPSLMKVSNKVFLSQHLLLIPIPHQSLLLIEYPRDY
jgi:hypothetical protein